MAPVSQPVQKNGPCQPRRAGTEQGPGTLLGAPEAWISLAKLRPRRAWLRFSRRPDRTRRDIRSATTLGHRSYALENPSSISQYAPRAQFPDEPEIAVSFLISRPIRAPYAAAR